MTIIPHEYATPVFTLGEVTVQYNTDRTKKRDVITGSLDAFLAFRQHWSDRLTLVEEFYVMCLNAYNEVVGIYLVSTGTTTGTMADPKIVFTVALGCHATSILIAHNHPSGHMQASQTDITLTRQYQQLGKLMNCQLLDHLILGPDSHVYYSFADEKLI